jgi:hypothetical protein
VHQFGQQAETVETNDAALARLQSPARRRSASQFSISSWRTDMSVLARLRQAGETLPIIFESS